MYERVETMLKYLLQSRKLIEEIEIKKLAVIKMNTTNIKLHKLNYKKTNSGKHYCIDNTRLHFSGNVKERPCCYSSHTGYSFVF